MSEKIKRTGWSAMVSDEERQEIDALKQNLADPSARSLLMFSVRVASRAIDAGLEVVAEEKAKLEK